MQHLEPEMLPTVVLVVAEGAKPLEVVHIKEAGSPYSYSGELSFPDVWLERWNGPDGGSQALLVKLGSAPLL